MQLIKNIANDVGTDHVVQVVTDNGSNYKKACQLLNAEYQHIVWQPCLAHTINLMLKDIGQWSDHEAIIESAKKICSWLYNSNSLHYMMKLAIGGELLKWNATRFGTNYMFLQSFMRKKDQFMQWMMTPEFRASRHFNSEQGRYAYANLTNLDWWANMQYVLEDVEPLYVFLRFADQDKVPTLGEVVVQYQNTKQTYAANLSQKNPTHFEHIMEIIDRRMSTVMLGTYVQGACALNPMVNYTMGITDSLMTVVALEGGPRPGGVVHPPNPRGWLPGMCKLFLRSTHGARTQEHSRI